MHSTQAMTLLGTSLLFAGCDAFRLTRPLSVRQDNSTSGNNNTSSGGLPDYLNPPNATGSYDIPGFDLSKPYDAATSNQTGWTLDIAVAASREVEGVTKDDYRGNPTYLSITTPENAFESTDFDSGWSICGNFWDIREDDLQAKFLGDNGTCESVLSDECIEDLRRQAASFSSCPNNIEIDEKKCPTFGISNSVCT